MHPVGHDDATMMELLDFPLLFVRSDDSKAPIKKKGWPTHTVTPEEIDQAFSADPKQGVAVKLGGPAGFIDIEGDGESAEMDWEILTNGIEVPATCQWQSTRGRHRLFQLTPELREIVGEKVVKTNDLEIRLGSGDRYTHYSIVPPSGDRRWETDLGVATLPLELAQRIGHLQQQDFTPYSSDYINPNPDAPGTVYNEQADWDDLLCADGWRKIGSRQDGVEDWCRPGKDDGLSATTGFCGDRLYVFTTEAPDLEAGLSYDKFQYLTFTQFGGNFAESAKHLAREGYQRAAEPESLFDVIPVDDDVEGPWKPAGKGDIIGIESWLESPTPNGHREFHKQANELLAKQKPADDDPRHIPTDLLMFPGFVEQFARFHALRSHRHDLRAGAIAGITLQSWLMGRKVKQADGTRPNLSTMMVGPSGIGKTAAVDTADALLTRLGFSAAIHNQFKSWQALQDQVATTPNMIYVQEEAQDILTSIVDPRDTARRELATMLKTIATASKGAYRCRGALKQDGGAGIHVDQPSLTVFLTGITDEVWGTLNDKLMRDGFVGRLWIVELFEMAERNYNPHEDETLLAGLLKHAVNWTHLEVETTEPPAPSGADQVTIGTILPRVVPRTEAGRELAIEFAKRCDSEVERGIEDGANTTSAWSRAYEMMCRFELLIAGSASAINCTITREMTQWAINLVQISLDQKTHRMESQAPADLWYQERVAFVLRAFKRLEERGKKVVTWRDLQRASNLKSTLVNDVVVDLMNQGKVCTDSKLSMDGSKIQVRGKYSCLYKNRQELAARSKKDRV